MSKIGKKIISVPQGVKVTQEGNLFLAEGTKGKLSLEVNPQATLKISEKEIVVEKTRNSKEANAIWGLIRSLVKNVLVGVSEGYQKKLELQGVGFRMSVQGKKLVMALGFSHPVEMEIPDGIQAAIEENNILVISGIDKQKVGQFAADVRSLKKVEPYKGKGFRYVGEKVIRKVGKKAGTAK